MDSIYAVVAYAKDELLMAIDPNKKTISVTNFYVLMICFVKMTNTKIEVGVIFYKSQ